MFWKEIKTEIKGSIGRRVGINDINCDMLVDDENITIKWAKCFEDLLNVIDKRKAIVIGIENEKEMPVRRMLVR